MKTSPGVVSVPVSILLPDRLLLGEENGGQCNEFERGNTDVSKVHPVVPQARHVQRSG